MLLRCKGAVLTLVTVLSAIVASVGSPTAVAKEDVTVWLTSGRKFTGHVDRRTSAERLWLRCGTETVQVLRPIDWDRVEHAEYQGDRLTVEQLRQLAETLKNQELPPTTPDHSAVDEAATAASVGEPTFAQRAREALGSSPRVQSVQFDVELANWDGDVETDGLLLRLYPLDAEGRIVSVGGTLEVNLVAVRSVDFDEVPTSRGKKVQRLQRWTRQIWPDDIGAERAGIRLPFQAAHPELDERIRPQALVHVRLSVPGHGVFEHSQDAVRIRPFAPLRDLRQRLGKPRFLSLERLGR